MANVLHSELTGTDLHEPKGITGADPGMAYIADGAGSGSWEQVQREGYTCMKCSSTGNTTGITNVYKELNSTNVGGTVTWSNNIKSDDIAQDLTNGYWSPSNAGIYNINASINFIPAGADTYSFTLGVDSGAGTTDRSSSILAAITVTSSAIGDTRNVAFTCIPNLGVGDKVYIMVKSDAGAEMTLTHVNFVAIRAS